jgi:hypothetical protein
MLSAAQKIGKAPVNHVITTDGSSRMHIAVEHHHGHLSSHKAMHLLEHLFEDFSIEPQYSSFGFRMLNELIKAEKTAHETHDFDMEGHHFHHHHEHSEGENNHHHHHNNNEHYDEAQVWLHEAQDILIDIMGAVVGLQELAAPTKAYLTVPVCFGGGSISFSHGTMKAPAPATNVMIEKNSIPVQSGPIEIELFTPTGAAALSALEAISIKELPVGECRNHGRSRGTKDLPIPALELFLF